MALTAVEQLVNYMKENFHLTDEALEKFEAAKQTEKEQKFHAFTKGYLSEFGSMDFEHYYTQTYGNNTKNK